MTKKFLTFVLALLAQISVFTTKAGDDWANFGKYEDANRKLERKPTAVFMGNSITEGWMNAHPDFFTANNFVSRGISGQTTYQMLLRFRDDVINLAPETVVILAGINDIAENNHSYNEDRTFGNIATMAEMAQANGINVVLCSVLPAARIHWREQITDVPAKVESLNNRLREYAESKGFGFVDYYAAMSGANGELDKPYIKKPGDAVHPNAAGYTLMEALILPVVTAQRSN